MTTKFNRNYKLTIQEDGKDAIIIEYPLTIEFTIQRATWSMSGTGKIRIYNLSKVTRRAIYKNPIEVSRFIRCKLEAGYGDNLSTIFDGDIKWARSSRAEGSVDFITELDVFNYAFVVDKSESPWSVDDAGKTAPPYATSKDQVIRRLCSDLKYPQDDELVSMPIGAIGSFDKAKRRSYVANGNTWDQLKTETDGKCFIDDGKVYCLGINEVIDGDITEISSETGLLGTPKVDGMYLMFDILFEQSLKIGQKVDLKSDTLTDFNGVYKVIAVTHSGTISGAVSGKCVTSVTLMVGSAGKEDPFTTVKQGL